MQSAIIPAGAPATFDGWDVDGNGFSDVFAPSLNINTITFSGPYSSNVSVFGHHWLYLGGADNMALAARKDVGLEKLGASADVGSAMPGLSWYGLNRNGRQPVLWASHWWGGGVSRLTEFEDEFQGFEDPQFIGFRFTKGGDHFYGWAKVQSETQTIDSDGFRHGTFRVLEAYLNDEPGQSIHVGDTGAVVPDGGSSMGLLALGAAGLAAFRQRRKAAAVEA